MGVPRGTPARQIAAVKVALPAGSRVTVVPMLPAPDGAAHAEPAVAVHVQVTPVTPAGNVSVTGAAVAALGPALLATIV